MEIIFYQEMLARVKADIHEMINYDQFGPYWLSPYYDRTSQTYTYHDNPEIFNGNAGICLFYLSLYQLNRETSDLRISTSILDRILLSSYIKQPRSYSFYTGISGIIYTCIKIYNATGKQHYLDKALEIARMHRPAFTVIREMDLLTGAAGILLVMTLLFHHSNEADIQEIVHQIIQLLIADARISKKGLKWDHHKLAFDSLTGLSHGAAGIAYALMQTGHYFKYDGLVFMAEKALEYEMQYYLPDRKNWLDIRVGARRYNLHDAQNWRLEVFFPELKLVNSWAHGAAGISLSRMYAYNITGKHEYNQQAQSGIQYCLADLANTRADYTLCSGSVGLVPLLLRSGQQHYDVIHNIFLAANELYFTTGGFNQFIETSPQDAGLFSGKAGVGYMLIQLLSGQLADDIILPQLPYSSHTKNNLFTRAYVSTSIYSKYYQQSLTRIKLKQEELNDIEDMEDIISQKIPDIDKSTFTLEKIKARIWQQHKGALCYHKKISFLKKTVKDILSRDDISLMDSTYYLPDHIILSQDNNVIEISSNDIKVLETGKFVTFILSILKEPATGHQLFQQILRAFPSRKEDDQVLKQFFLLQLKSLLHACIIAISIKKGGHL
ncbi:lanthionine synthetase LanC family protein [Chitinophaga sp. LS1]|uniref:lanthionine synthetase LanC family protein n=1 Tax=Chitinophaga sp. LS1 TaxID=3051176 RepID=UPI002AAB5A71|nr:lanthionine synthetase LanC family protein [Chitinophaga sp. LS1]WPV66366.1 lanthionine synthetase LanC family protein [Chitinophaga sp. LS1]